MPGNAHPGRNHEKYRQMTQTLSLEEVTRLLGDRTPERRAAAVNKVVKHLVHAELSERERTAATEIFRELARDMEERVRAAMAFHVKESELLPHDVALHLARDVDSVAAPILQYSEVLTDDDLLEIAQSFSQTKMKAVAGRREVGATLAEVLADKGDEDVVSTLVGNDGAALTEASMQKVLDRFGESERVHAPLSRRAQLPIAVAERLVTLVSDRLQEYLVTHHELDPATASDIVLQSRERATLGLVADEDGAGLAVEALVAQLEANGRLSATIVLRSLCMGDTVFFEHALARLADVPVVNARVLIHDKGELGLRKLFEKAGLPDVLFPAFRVAVDVVDETELDGEADDRERRSRRIIQRILTQYENLGSENLEYLLAKLGKLNPATVH